METRPEPTPEGKLIDDAAALADISIREAARRAGISYGRWRQIAKGFQNISPGVFAPVRDAPAKTIAKMARAVNVSPEQLVAAGREDAAVILADLLRPEPTATPEPAAEPTSPDDADAMENAVIVAALPRREREVWAEMRRNLQATPAGRDLFASPRQAALWPEGGAPAEVTPEAKHVLDSTPPDVLFTARSDVLAASLVMCSWHERVQWAAAGRALLRHPTSAVRRAG
jgi:hypothetical protein